MILWNTTIIKKLALQITNNNLNIMFIGDDVLQGIKFVKSLRICKLKKKNSLTHCDSLPYE